MFWNGAVKLEYRLVYQVKVQHLRLAIYLHDCTNIHAYWTVYADAKPAGRFTTLKSMVVLN
jgi:hypothetical protein